MLSLARSRYALLPQVAFVATNAFGVMLGSIYNASTPDLYPNNAHHKIGWIATSAVTLQLVIALLARVAGTLKGRAGTAGELRPFIPVSAANMAEHQRMNDSRFPKLHRISHDSGQGTEPNTESLRAQSVSSSSGAEEAPIRMQNVRKEEDDDDQDLESIPLGPRQRKVPGGIAAKLASFISTKAWRFLIFTYNSIDRSILILGFIAICTGIITYARFFVSLPRVWWIDVSMQAADSGAGGTRNIHGSCPLDQGWHLFLARDFHFGAVVWLIWRARMGSYCALCQCTRERSNQTCVGMECAAKEGRPEMAADSGIRRKRAHLFLRVDQHLLGASR